MRKVTKGNVSLTSTPQQKVAQALVAVHLAVLPDICPAGSPPSATQLGVCAVTIRGTIVRLAQLVPQMAGVLEVRREVVRREAAHWGRKIWLG